MRKLLLLVAIFAASNANAIATSVAGTWKYEDVHVSMVVRLADDGTCRVTAKLDTGPGMDALCTYAIYGDAVVIAWRGGFNVGGTQAAPVRMLFDAASDTFVVEGESERVLTRSGRAVSL